MTKFLDTEGLKHLWSKIKNGIDSKADASIVESLEKKIDALEVPVEAEDTEIQSIFKK